MQGKPGKVRAPWSRVPEAKPRRGNTWAPERLPQSLGAPSDPLIFQDSGAKLTLLRYDDGVDRGAKGRSQLLNRLASRCATVHGCVSGCSDPELGTKSTKVAFSVGPSAGCGVNWHHLSATSRLDTTPVPKCVRGLYLQAE